MQKTSYPKAKIKVLLLEDIHEDAEKILAAEGYPVERLSGALDEKELIKKIKGVSILGIRSKTKVTRAVLEEADKLLAIGAFCIGTNQIDLTAASEKGVAVFNAPYSNTRSVVELALGEIIMLMRRTFERSTGMHAGKWEKSAKGSFEIRGKKLGIIGYGNIGSQLSVLAELCGMEVYYYDLVEKLALGNAKRCDTVAKLLKTVDIVTLHVDGRPENRGAFGDAEFKLMKQGSYFLNLSRGFVVDTKALRKHVEQGRIAGAAVDVFPAEPKTNQETFESELKGLLNVILTPHIGGSTKEAQVDIAHFVPERLLGYVNSGNSFGSVNFPNIQLPPFVRAHRLIHVHKNVPGILAQINGVLAKKNINVLGQYLKTNEHIGYVITDINKNHDKQIIEDLKNIPNTTKCRILY